MTEMFGDGVVLQRRRNRRVWHAKRRHVLGATDCVAVLGYHPSRTPLDVWLEKTGRAGPDRVAGTYEARRGHALESLLLEHWATETGAEPVPVPPLIAHPAHRRIAASLDGAGLVGGVLHVVDAKTAAWEKKDAWWDESTAAPDHYLAQVLIQCAVAGAPAGWLAADVAGHPTVVGPIPRDRTWEGWALPVLSAWWARHVAADTPPPPDPVRDYPNLNRAWIPDPGETLTADEDLLALVADYRQARTDAKTGKAAAAELKGRVRIAMGTAGRIVTPDPEHPQVVASIDARGALTLPRTDPLRKEPNQ